jgi:YgiT-type zinc finger domain-containing protein
MRCDVCDSGDRQPAFRSRLAEKNGHTAMVLGVPVEECPACGQVWLTMGTAVRLDELFDQLLAGGEEMAQIHWVPLEQPE